MSLITVKQDLFKTNADVLVNPVNTKGVSGCGVALLFKKRYPLTQALYEEACRNRWIKLGIPYIISVPQEEQINDKPKYIICFPTKIAPSGDEKTKLSTISNGLSIIKNRCTEGFFPKDFNIALPLLGCGAGGIKDKGKQEVVNLINSAFVDVPQTVILCEV